MTDSTKNRALKAFASMDTIPDRYITAAEDALYEAEAGIRRPEKTPTPFLRFLNSGWGVAVISGLVALTVLIFIVRAGQNPTNPPPAPPVDSTPETDVATTDFTIAPRSPLDPVGTEYISVILSSGNPQASYEAIDVWYLEKLTAEGPVKINTPIESTAFEVAADDTTRKVSLTVGALSRLDAGLYRIHAIKQEGDELISLADCTFTVSEEAGRILNKMSFHGVTPPIPYTIDVPDMIYGADSLTITITATEPGVALTDLPRHWLIWKLDDRHWPHDDQMNPWTVSEPTLMSSPENGDYASYTLTFDFHYPPEWTEGPYELIALTEPLDEDNHTLSRCRFSVQDIEVLESYIVASYEDKILPPSISLMDNGSFCLTFGGVSSFIGIGDYEERGGLLYLRYHTGEIVWVFERVGEHLAYRKDLSDTPRAPSFSDGQMFYREASAEPPFTIATEQNSYPADISSFTVIMTGKNKGESISMQGDWYLERLTEDGGAEKVQIYYNDLAIESAKPDRDEYASIRKTLHINGIRIPLAGTYRLHAIKHDGEKYVSVAYCTFTIGDSSDLTADADYGIRPMREVYPTGANRVEIFAEGKTLFASIPQNTGWVLEKLTSSGYTPLEIEFEPGEDKMAVPDGNVKAWFYKEIRIPEALEAGTYRLHMVEESENTRTFLTHCTFTVGETTPEVWNFYVLDGEPSGDNALPPMLTLWDDGSFHLRFGETDARAKSGRYKEKSGVLTLYASDGSVWVFESGNKRLWWFFRAEQSSAGTASLLADGCKFGYRLHTTLGAPEDVEVRETYATVDYLTNFFSPASLSLLENGEFYLDFMAYASSDFNGYHNPYGTYEEAGGRLYLDSESDGSRLVFEKAQGHLRLLTEESSGPCLSKFKENCLFYSMSLLTGATDQP